MQAGPDWEIECGGHTNHIISRGGKSKLRGVIRDGIMGELVNNVQEGDGKWHRFFKMQSSRDNIADGVRKDCWSCRKSRR